ncbi:MAG TPA: protein-glutamate O-methyltransferase CheR [Blastocatellia bacterium]|jgi:chemotaxis protein methyltransferase CheR
MGNAKRSGSKTQEPLLDEATFQKLRKRITTASGIYIVADQNARFLIERRLAPRLRLRGHTSFADYEETLDEQELEALLDVIAVHETYFFREERQLKAFTGEILPELESKAERLSIWSAGCSSGEEAYTIAMLLAEQGLLKNGQVSITASDLSQRVIESAIRGVYGQSSFRTTDQYYKDKYFSREGATTWRVCDDLCKSLRFVQQNLIKLAASLGDGRPGPGEIFDVIFCRNVLMYFDDAAVKKTLMMFHSLLKEGGYLLLGHAESLLPHGLGLRTVQMGRELAYKK